MIKKLKRKFILLTMTSLFALLLVIVAGMNIMNYTSVVAEADDILSILTKNGGDFPDIKNIAPDSNGTAPDHTNTITEFTGGFGKKHMSPEVPFESRYFSVQFDSSGSVVFADTGKIAAIDKETAISYAQSVYNDTNGKGFVKDFRFKVTQNSEGLRITFLDCGRKIDAFYRFLLFSLIMSAIGYVIVGIIVIIMAGKIIRPISESYEKQKRFITDAGHEIKTPLTIINANADILEDELGIDNECLQDIQVQTARLTELTNDLVYLSRMEEQKETLTLIEIPASDLILEMVNTFRAPAMSQRKKIQTTIQPMLTIKGDTKSIEKLVSILMNNALKYSPEGSDIFVTFEQNKKQVIFSVENTSCYTVEQENLAHVFDRFYRADSSRNSETGGHGIGLSMANAIMDAHKGSIKAWTKDGQTFGISAVFPL